MNNSPTNGWPKIKLVDARGHTMTVFSRQPKIDTPVADENALSATEVLDLPRGVKPPLGVIPDDLRGQVIDEYSEWIAQFVAEHNRLPGTDAEHLDADAAALAQALEDVLAARGLRLVGRDEHVQFARSIAAEADWYVNCVQLRQVTADPGDGITIKATATRFVGEPGNDSEWVSNPKPRSKRAAAHVRADLDRDGFALPHNQNRLTLELPSIEVLAPVLDDIAQHGQAGDVLTLTVGQLQRLLAHRC